RIYLMSARLRHTSAVSSFEASSTTITSTSEPALCALSTARESRCGRLCVGMITLTCDILLFNFGNFLIFGSWSFSPREQMLNPFALLCVLASLRENLSHAKTLRRKARTQIVESL